MIHYRYAKAWTAICQGSYFFPLKMGVLTRFLVTSMAKMKEFRDPGPSCLWLLAPAQIWNLWTIKFSMVEAGNYCGLAWVAEGRGRACTPFGFVMALTVFLLLFLNYFVKGKYHNLKNRCAATSGSGSGSGSASDRYPDPKFDIRIRYGDMFI